MCDSSIVSIYPAVGDRLSLSLCFLCSRTFPHILLYNTNAFIRQTGKHEERGVLKTNQTFGRNLSRNLPEYLYLLRSKQLVCETLDV